MKMEQMMECLIAATGGLEIMMHKKQAKSDASLREIRANEEEMKEGINSGQAEKKSTVSAILEKTEACLGKTEATDLEANPQEIESEAEHEEVPKKEASIET
jgi:hypothetical protein